MHKKYQTPLAKIQSKKIDTEKLKQEGWKQNGILVVNINDDRLNWPEKEIIKQIGDKIYNQKKRTKNGK